MKFLKTCSFPSLERVVAEALAAAKIKKNKEHIKKTSHFSGAKFLKTCSFPSLKRVVAAALAAAKTKKSYENLKKYKSFFQGLNS